MQRVVKLMQNVPPAESPERIIHFG